MSKCSCNCYCVTILDCNYRQNYFYRFIFPTNPNSVTNCFQLFLFYFITLQTYICSLVVRLRSSGIRFRFRRICSRIITSAGVTRRPEKRTLCFAHSCSAARVAHVWCVRTHVTHAYMCDACRGVCVCVCVCACVCPGPFCTFFGPLDRQGTPEADSGHAPF